MNSEKNMFQLNKVKLLLSTITVAVIITSLLTYGISITPSPSISQSDISSSPKDYRLVPRYEIAQEQTMQIDRKTTSIAPAISQIASVGSTSAEFIIPTIFIPAFAVSPTQTSLPYQDWAIPTVASLPYDLEVDKTNNKYVYYAEQICTIGGNPNCPNIPGKIARLDTSNNVFTEWNIPTSGTVERNVFVDSLGSVWFAEAGSPAKIGRLVPSTNQITEWSFPVGVGGPIDVAMDPSGNVWWTAQSFGGISKLNPATNTLTRYIAAGTVGSNPFGITTDSNGMVFISDANSNQILRFDPTLNKFTIWALPVASSNPNTAAFDSFGNLWFVELGNRIGKLDPSSNDLTEYPLPTANSGPNFITIDASDTVFFSENLGNKVGRLNPATNTITEWSITGPGVGSRPLGIGTDSTYLYVAENNGNKIGRLG